MNPEKNDQLASQPSIESLKIKLELSANRRAESSLNYCERTKKDFADFARQAAEEPFAIHIDCNDPESMTLGVFEVQRKLGFALELTSTGCDGILGPYTYAKFEAARQRYIDGKQLKKLAQAAQQNTVKLQIENKPQNSPADLVEPKRQPLLIEEIKAELERTNEVSFERREFTDTVTGYTIEVFVPQGADGSTEVLFTGQDETVEETLAHMEIREYLQQQWKSGRRQSYSIIIGKDSGHSGDKYSALKTKPNALTSILNGIDATVGVTGPSRAVIVNGWSRGGEAMRYVAASNDPALSRVTTLNNYDNSYGSMAALAQYAKDNPKCKINFAFQDAEGNGTRKFGKEFQSLTAELPNVNVQAVKGLMHIGIARDYQKIFAGLSVEGAKNVS